jgi:tRNA (adenine37-N6)-methyltransferase
MKFTLNSIGTVKEYGDMFCLVLKEEYRKGLIGLKGFSHLQILWWADQVDEENLRKTVLLEKPYVKGPEQIGIFGTRSPVRPNPIAVTTVGVVEIQAEKGILIFPYIDAEPETPVLDIKPYLPSTERVKGAVVPSWCSHWPQWYEDSANFNWEEEFNFE